MLLNSYGRRGWGWCWKNGMMVQSTSWLLDRIRFFTTQHTRKPTATTTTTITPSSSTTTLSKEQRKKPLLFDKDKNNNNSHQPLLPYQMKSSSRKTLSPRFIQIYGNDVDAAMQRLSKIISMEGLPKKMRELRVGTEPPCHVARRERKERERAQQRRFVQETLKQVIQERQQVLTAATTTGTSQQQQQHNKAITK
jgi:hypothetical protein